MVGSFYDSLLNNFISLKILVISNTLLFSLECTPETPQEKVRTKRKKKPAKITQSTESPKVYEEGPIQVVTTRLEEFRDILPPEEITLREPVVVASPKQQVGQVVWS